MGAPPQNGRSALIRCSNPREFKRRYEEKPPPIGGGFALRRAHCAPKNTAHQRELRRVRARKDVGVLQVPEGQIQLASLPKA